MCLIAKNFGLQEENINISKPQERHLIRRTGWGTTERERERQMGTKRERGREDAVLYEKSERCYHLS